MMIHRRQRSGPARDFAVIGLGRFGSSLALTLMRAGHSVLGIDRDPHLVQQLADDLTQTVALDSSDEEALRQIDVASMETVVVAIGTNLESNLLTTVALKSLGVANVLCKAATERQRDILLKVGADRVVLPEHEAGQRLAQDIISMGQLRPVLLGEGHHIEEVKVPGSLVGMSLREADLRRRFGVSVLVAKRGTELTVSPPPDYFLVAGDRLVVLGTVSDIAHFASSATQPGARKA